MPRDQAIAAQHDSREDRAILSFALLLAVLVAGVVVSLSQAQPSAAVSSLFSILN